MKNNLINRRYAVLIILIVITLTVVNSCGGGSDHGSGSDAVSGTPVQVSHPVLADMSDNLSLNATTVFLSKEIVRATFQGFIRQIYKNIGDRVNPGDKLFIIQTKELATGDTVNFKVGNELFSGEVAIRASSSGVLAELDYHVGDFVSDGEQIAVITNPSSLRLRLNVPFEDNSKVKIGERCRVNLPGGVTLPGTVEKNVPSVDPGTQTQTFYIKLSRNKELPENLNTIVTIPFKSYEKTVAVPKSAVITDVTQDNFWIMMLANDSTAVRVNINKGVENDSLVQVLNPKLDTSARIISDGAYGLPDTAKIAVVK